jgi:hypothetical protein
MKDELTAHNNTHSMNIPQNVKTKWKRKLIIPPNKILPNDIPRLKWSPVFLLLYEQALSISLMQNMVTQDALIRN